MNIKKKFRENMIISLLMFLVTLILVVHDPEPLLIRHCSARAIEEMDTMAWEVSPVTLQVTDNQVVMENGILQVTFSKPDGFVTGIQFGGIDNVLEVHNGETNRGYWDVLWNGEDEVGDDNQGFMFLNASSSYYSIVGTEFEIIKSDENQVEISFMTTWDSASARNERLPLNIDRRFVMLRGSSGYYAYGIYEREEGWPATSIAQIRAVYKLQNDKFHYMALSDNIQRVMPTPQDRETGQVLDYPEAVRLTNPVDPSMKGEVDDKYQYSYEDKDTMLHGWVSSDPPVGFWLITPSNEYRSAGPVKRDLTSHVGPISLVMFHSNHYVGKELTLDFQDGEPWRKVFGPFFVHLNAVRPQPDPHKTLWKAAKKQMYEEMRKWPYSFPLSEDFPKSDERGSVEGRLHIQDRSKILMPASYAWVGLAAPGEAGSWQQETKGYQFWVQAGKDGSFTIRGIRPGAYNLYAWADGFLGDYKYESEMRISAGSEMKLGDLIYEPPRSGPTVWEIGVPDRSAAEFYVPDPRPELINRLYVHDEQNKYRQYGLWDRYTDLYPTHDLVYTVGVSDYRRDWFFAQVNRQMPDGSYEPSTWQIVFPLSSVAAGQYTLWIALAAANEAILEVRFNSHKSSATPDFTTGFIGKDNAIARHGIHGLYRLFCVAVESSLLQQQNTIYLTQTMSGSPFEGVMYDYIRLEGPSA